MVTTDPIADMLTRIRNALRTCKKTVDVPYSKIKDKITQILLKHGYITSFEVLNDLTDIPQGIIRITLKYAGKTSSIIGLRRISKPGCRCYSSKATLPRVLKGLGIAIVSTSKGVMTDKEARRQKVGGEVLAYIW